MSKRIAIPDNPAGRLAFKVFRAVAEKMLAVGNEATNDFALSNFPDGKTVRKDYADRQFLRVIKIPTGEYITVIYDYTAQTTAATQLPYEEPERGRKHHGEMVEASGNRRGDNVAFVPAT